jgi:capsular polysaccharide transport system permease protein
MKRLLRLASPRNLRLGVIAVPWALAALYLTLFAADRYVAESVVAVRENGDTPIVGADALTTLFAGSAPASREDELMLETHVLSMDMLKQLEQALDLKESYSAPRLDLLFRLSPDATREQYLDYYRRRVEVLVDDESGLLQIRTQAFTPEAAQAVNRQIIALSERFINESSHRLAREQMEFAEQELEKARAAVNDARGALLAFQSEHGVLDPVAQATANTGLTVELQAALARQEAELKALLGYLNEDAHQVQGLKTQIAGTRSQLEAESVRAMSSDDGTSLNVLAGEFQELAANLQFAQDTYKLALSGLETARVESTRKLKSLVLVESPALPESARYPRRLYTLFALLMGLGLLYGIVRLVVATIEDHQE